MNGEGLKMAMEEARAQLESIIEMVNALNNAETDEQREEAEQAIHEDPLEIRLKGEWSPGETPDAQEFVILLCTGGPAVRITGTLSNYHEPDSAQIECQDWFTPWEKLPVNTAEEEALIDYARCFYFGD